MIVSTLYKANNHNLGGAYIHRHDGGEVARGKRGRGRRELEKTRIEDIERP